MRRILRSVPSLPLLLFLHLSGCTVVFMSHGGHVKSVAITPASAMIAVGTTQPFRANVTFTDGTILVVTTSNLVWSVSDPAVASISTDGVAKGLKAGSVTVTGTFISVSGTASLTITATGVAQPQISGSAGKLSLILPGSAQQFTYAVNPIEDTISMSRTDLLTGLEAALVSVSVAPASKSVWLAIDSAGKFLYVANHGSGDISAFAINPTSGGLTPIVGSPFPVDAAPWSIAVEPSGQSLIASHFDSSTVSRFRIDQLYGVLSPER